MKNRKWCLFSRLYQRIQCLLIINKTHLLHIETHTHTHSRTHTQQRQRVRERYDSMTYSFSCVRPHRKYAAATATTEANLPCEQYFFFTSQNKFSTSKNERGKIVMLPSYFKWCLHSLCPRSMNVCHLNIALRMYTYPMPLPILYSLLSRMKCANGKLKKKKHFFFLFCFRILCFEIARVRLSIRYIVHINIHSIFFIFTYTSADLFGWIVHIDWVRFILNFCVCTEYKWRAAKSHQSYTSLFAIND